MRSIVDKEAKAAITQLCDRSLRVGGIQAMGLVNQVMGTMIDQDSLKCAIPEEQNQEKKPQNLNEVVPNDQSKTQLNG